MDGLALEQPFGHFLGAAPPVSHERISRDLYEAALLYEFQNHRGFIQQRLIAFRMSNDGNHAAAGDEKQVPLYLWRDAEVAELHQQILRFARSEEHTSELQSLRH